MNYSKEGFKKEIKFCVDIQTIVNGVKNNIRNETSQKAKQILTNFQIEVNNYFQRNIGKDIFLGRKREELDKVFNKLNNDCTQIIIKTFKNKNFRNLIVEKLEQFVGELIKIRNLKMTN